LKQEFERIITHNDFDGVASAAICSYFYDVDTFIFTGPNTIARSEITVTEKDIVCDLPYPLVAGLWFDHHVGNVSELKLRGIDPDAIPGAFADKPSCCRVVYEYLSQEEKLPDDFLAMSDAADVIDSFAYSSVEEWRKETPAKRIDWAIKAPGTTREKHRFLRMLVALLRDTSIDAVAKEPWVNERATAYLKQEEWMRKLVKQVASFLPQDTDHEVVILDMTRFRRREKIIKNLALLDYPQALAFLEIQPMYSRHGGARTTDLSFSMSLSLNLNSRKHSKDVGEIMRELNLGDGHAGAGAGILNASGKADMLRKKDDVLDRIFELWKSQYLGKSPRILNS
jgi:hypothetical protein